MKIKIVQSLVETSSNLPSTLKDISFFLGFIFLGVFYKVRKASLKGSAKKATIIWFIAEGLMSLFIALIGLALLDHFLSLPKFLTFGMCALLGSMSTVIHDKLESLLVYTIDSFKNVIDKKPKHENN